MNDHMTREMADKLYERYDYAYGLIFKGYDHGKARMDELIKVMDIMGIQAGYIPGRYGLHIYNFPRCGRGKVKSEQVNDILNRCFDYLINAIKEMKDKEDAE